MRKLTITGQNDKGEVKYERPIVVGKQDILILQFPEHTSDETAQSIVDAFNRALQSTEEKTKILGLSHDIKIRTLRIEG